MNGYFLIYEPQHPKALHGTGWEGYVYEHLIEAEKSIGRPLTEKEVVHHLDGNRGNNRQSNLLVLENGQHAKLHQWLRKIEIMEKESTTKPKTCEICGAPLNGKQVYACSIKCSAMRERKVERPSKETLTQEIKEVNNFSALGRKYGVTDNTIRKWAKAYGIL